MTGKDEVRRERRTKYEERRTPGGNMIIDGYCHCGLSKYLPVDDVLHVMDRAKVDRAVLCQHLGEYDNGYLARVVAQYPDRFTGVCLVDPTQGAAVAELHRWHAMGCFHGVRLLTEWLASYEENYAEAARLGWIFVLYAPDGIASAIQPIQRFASRHPAARLVITHLGNPRVTD